jgi:hypothetical protein
MPNQAIRLHAQADWNKELQACGKGRKSNEKGPGWVVGEELNGEMSIH